MPSQPGSSAVYATFTVRMRALVTDVMVQTAGIIATFVMVAVLEDVPGIGRLAAIALIAIALLYEPLQVGLRGATVGHRRANLRVVSDTTGGNPSVAAAYLRFVLKAILGLPSFTMMLFTRRHQAWHDVLTHTTVQVTDVSRAREFDIALEREPDEGTEIMPPLAKRVFMTIMFMLVGFVIIVIAEVLLVSEPCLASRQCSELEQLTMTVIGILMFASFIVVATLGWLGRLPGARRKLRQMATEPTTQ